MLNVSVTLQRELPNFHSTKQLFSFLETKRLWVQFLKELFLWFVKNGTTSHAENQTFYGNFDISEFAPSGYWGYATQLARWLIPNLCNKIWTVKKFSRFKWPEKFSSIVSVITILSKSRPLINWLLREVWAVCLIFPLCNTVDHLEAQLVKEALTHLSRSHSVAFYHP